MNKTISLLALALFLAVSGCGSGVDPSTSQHYLFEGAYIGHLDYDHSGFSIDVDGNVYSFESQQTETSEFDRKDEHTTEEMAAHYAPDRKFVRTIPRDSLEMMKSLIASVGEETTDTLKERTSDTFNLCVTYGIFDDSFYRYDAGRQIYSRVVIQRSGDLTFTNTSSSGKTIAEWLQRIEAEIGQ